MTLSFTLTQSVLLAIRIEYSMECSLVLISVANQPRASAATTLVEAINPFRKN